MTSGTDKKSEAKTDGIARKWYTDSFNVTSESPPKVKVQRTGIKSLTFTLHFLMGTLLPTLKLFVFAFIVTPLKDINTRK